MQVVMCKILFMKRLLFTLCLAGILAGCNKKNSIDLSGQWLVTTDSSQHLVTLPGSLTENGIGYPVNDSATNRLSEPVTFTGPATYEREVSIPKSWIGKPVELFMERTKVSQLFVNDSLVGLQNSVSTPHVYVVGNFLKPGKNHLRITVDNTKKLLPLGGSHAYSEHTQSNWNGILGQFYLRRLPDVCIQNAQIYPGEDGLCQIKFEAHASISKEVKVRLKVLNRSGKAVAENAENIYIQSTYAQHECSIAVPSPQLWDEYNPYTYTLLIAAGGDTQRLTFGIRNFRPQGKQLANNGRIVFLRGKHEGGVFPLTAYPSMKKEDWRRNMSIAQSHGINHYRFHSWCPPKAAFEAADELGVFLQPELPLWGRYKATDTTLLNYMIAEGERIMKEYGNHPSFVMFALGNELEGDTSLMAEVVNHLRTVDNRHLYALGSNNFYWDPQAHPAEDFFVAMRNGKPAADYSTDLRGSFSFADSKEGGIINNTKPNTIRDFSQATQMLHKPTIGHETGQYQIFPDFKETARYTGVMQPRNLAVFKQRLEKAGMAGLADAFVKASGALAALCYKEETEMALRTGSFGGFQLLDLQDYPGQGTALVGILNAFMEPKGVIEPQKWREFCNDVVPLARFEKYCWTNKETFTAAVEVANYGPHSLHNQEVQYTLQQQSGRVIFTKKIYEGSIPQGKVNSIAKIELPLQEIIRPEQLLLTVSLTGTSYKNTWNIWVYPASSQVNIREGLFGNVAVTRSKKIYEQACRQGNVRMLYIPLHNDISAASVGGLFTTDFWNYSVFKNVALSLKKELSPGTMGILVNNKHPVFELFPTDFHSNWQWWSIVKNARPAILDGSPQLQPPIAQAIDNCERNHRLGLIYETPAANSKILVCTSDLFACQEEPEVKQLFLSMIKYLQQ